MAAAAASEDCCKKGVHRRTTLHAIVCLNCSCSCAESYLQAGRPSYVRTCCLLSRSAVVDPGFRATPGCQGGWLHRMGTMWRGTRVPMLACAPPTLGYPPILLHHLRLRRILMYCLLTWDRLDATSSGRARKGLSAGCALLLLPPAVLLLLLLSAAWLLEAGFSSTELGKEGPSLLSSLGEDDRDAAALKLTPAGNCHLALPLMLQACLSPVIMHQGAHSRMPGQSDAGGGSQMAQPVLPPVCYCSAKPCHPSPSGVKPHLSSKADKAAVLVAQAPFEGLTSHAAPACNCAEPDDGPQAFLEALSRVVPTGCDS